ncbi:MAG: hypothetical protein OXH61_15015 [Acidimicrobiaceae bacterium]|nr:hypothetical protein [Acidimicrobiaceae bacterium]
MSDQTISKDALNGLPNAVQEKIGENLRSYFETLVDYLDQGHIAEDENRDSVVSLLDWTLSVLREAGEPLTTQVFEKLAEPFGNVMIYVGSQDWVSYRAAVPDVLLELSCIPTVRPQHSIEAAQSLGVGSREVVSA